MEQDVINSDELEDNGERFEYNYEQETPFLIRFRRSDENCYFMIALCYKIEYVSDDDGQEAYLYTYDQKDIFSTVGSFSWFEIIKNPDLNILR